MTVDELQLLRTSGEGLRTLLNWIQGAQKSVRLEMYIFRAESPGPEFLAALTAAAARGVKVRVQIDAVGSQGLPDSFWTGFRAAGGKLRVFNPLGSGRFLTRDHRKLCVVDDEVALIFGFNIGAEYAGDGVEKGWRDLGIQIKGPSVAPLAEIFDRQYLGADFRPRLLARFQKRQEQMPEPAQPDLKILPVNPGREDSCLLTALYEDLLRARRIWICAPYFVPPPRFRRMLRRGARHGADVRLVLPAKNDVPLARFAARWLYAGLLRSGVQIYEYQPQVLHAKLLVMDQAVYVGSSNLDPRSLHLNYELMIRATRPPLLQEAVEVFNDLFAQSRPVLREEWRDSRSWGAKLRERWSFFLLYRLDPWLTHGLSLRE